MEHPVQEWQNYAYNKWLHLPSDDKNKFSTASDLTESFMVCWAQIQQEEEDVLERLCCDLSVKKEPRAVLFYKQEGNKRFGRKQYTAAAALYSKAISHASPHTEEMAICFANRSAVLFHLAHYSVCIEDIEHAQEHGLPERLKSKVLQRQSECLERLKISDPSGGVFPKAEGVDPSKLHNTGKPEVLHLKSNTQLTNAACSLQLHTSSPKGRHLKAIEEIKQGEVLIQEDAFVSVLIPDRNTLSTKRNWDTGITNCELYCHHCLERVIASLPCPYCSFAKYCCQHCMDTAWRQYHCTECSLGEALLTVGVFCQTALRTVLVAGSNKVSELICRIRTSSVQDVTPSQQEVSASGAKYSSDYEAVVNLLPHVEHHKVEFRFLCGWTAAALCKKLCLNKLGEDVGALSLSEKHNMSEDERKCGCSSEPVVFGTAILRHMLQLHCNAQAVMVLQEEQEVPYSSVESQKSSRIATAVFPILSLLNHSCDANTNVSFQGRCATVRASRSIQKGEEVTHCYGPHKLRMSVRERQKLLKAQYFFTCQCDACTQEFASGDTSTDFCCPKCSSPLKGEDELHCPNAACEHRIRKDQLLLQLQHLEHTVSTTREKLQSNHIAESITMLKSCLSEAKEFLSPNHKILGEIYDQLAQAEASKGNWKAAGVHLRRSTRLVELQYGSSSLELGHELFKLAQILFNGDYFQDV
uniref:Protein-lysine N-methyltransferase SMYD4 n=1 Tax=Leptobrachium leishanense TaxID=445787 RepID=A0A8C5MLP1_9ANUR